MRWKTNGIRETNNSWGAVEICPTPHIGKYAWLHTIYKGLSREDITHLENKMFKKIPEDYKEYLSYMNGAELFSGNLTLYGFSQSKINLVIRDGVEAIQPYDMVVENLDYKRIPPTWLRIGSIWKKRNEIFMDSGGRVYACEYRKNEVVKDWPSFWEYLLFQVESFTTKYDERGVALDEARPSGVKANLGKSEEEKNSKKNNRTKHEPVKDVEASEPPPDEIRDAKTIAKRTLALLGTIAYSLKEPREEVTSWLKDNDLWSELTPNERAYLTAENPTKKQHIDATWRSECLIVLLWALGKVDKLPAPNEKCDPSLFRELLPPYGPVSFADFISTAKRRSDEVLLKAADELMDLHWQARDAVLNGREVPQINVEIIQERHHAINWIIGYGGLPWDDVTTDT
jgi:hypothetical protein